MVTQKGPKSLFKYGVTPSKVVFYSIKANTPCSFTKQDLAFKQAHCVSFCFVLCNEPKF